MSGTRTSAAASLMIEALETAATEAAGAKTELVSVSIEIVGPANFGMMHTSISRKTRSLVFANVELKGADGAPAVTASSIHKIVGAGP